MNNYFASLYNLDFNEDEQTLYVFDSNYISYAIQSVHNSEKFFNALEKVIDKTYLPFILKVLTTLEVTYLVQKTHWMQLTVYLKE